MIEFRPLAKSENGDAVTLWEACSLTRPLNDPAANAGRALEGPHSTIIGALAGNHLLGTAMTGWDVHRRWIYYLGVEKDRWAIGRKLIPGCEDWLAQLTLPRSS
jgi:hypothetical protein